ncbi:ESPR-type extended signal peptide-containing protein [Ursidibacter arcticus]
MNKVFKVIWNYSTQSWVAVSELAKGHAKSSSTNTNNISELNLDYPNTGKAASATVIGAALAVTVLTSVWSPMAYAGTPINQGDGAKATGQDSIAIGTNANSSGTSDIAIGKSSFTNATNATAVGVSSKASAENAAAFGAGAVASQLNSIAVGVNAKATGNNSTAIGQGAQAKNENALAIGTNSTADNKNTVAIGYGAKATNEGAFAFGSNVSSRSDGSLGLGTDSVAWGRHSVAIGTNATTNGGEGSIAFGLNANVSSGKASIAFGADSNATAERGSAFGANSTAGRWAAAFGSNATANASRAVAVGEGATASKDSAVAIGNGTTASQSNTVALGNQAEASGSNSAAIGNKAVASATNALAFGNGANASTANSVALGNGATTATAGTVSNLNFNKADASNNALSVAGMTGVTGTVSVGKSGALRQIQNVAAGRVTSNSTDAVNGSQLYTVMENVGFNIYENTAAKSRIDNNNKVTFADGNFTTANVSGASDATVKFNVVTQDITSTEATQITAPTGTAGLAKAVDVVNAINNAGFTLKANSETSGEAITNGDSVTIKEGTNINVTRAGSEITIKTADEVEFTSVKTGSLTATGPTNLNGGVSVKGGLAMNDGKITGLKAGTDKADAVNVEQLDKVKEIAEKGWNVTIAKVEGGEAESASDTKVAPGDKVTHIAGKNIKLVQNGANITVSTTDKVNFSEVTADKTNAGELTATSATVNGPTILNGTATVKDKLTAEKGATISGGNLEMSDNKITGLQAGTDDEDAVNVAQLNETVKNSGWKLKINDEEDTAAEKVNNDEVVTFEQGDNIVITRDGKKVTVATSQTPTFTNLTTKEGANIGGKLDVAGPATFKDSVTAEKGATIKGGDLVMSDNKITGLKAGTDKTDAVNVEQLDKVKEIAEKGWNVTIAKVEGGEAESATDTNVAPGDKVTHIAGKNIKLVQNGANITVSTTENVTFTNVDATTVNATDVNTTNVTSTGKANLNDLTVTGNTTIGGEGKTFTIAGKTSVDMGGNVVSNVAAGVADNDAVNVNQLKESGWKLKINDEEDTAAEKVNPDEVVTFKQGDNIVITREGQNVTVATSQTPTFTNLTTTEGANIGGDLNVSGSTTLGDTNVGGKGNTFAVKEGTKVDMGGNKISNVANGDISPNSTDAVNGAQIFALTGGQGAPNVTPSYTTTITNPDGSKTELKHENVVVDENGKPLLVTYNVQDQKEHVTNSVITAINHMNTQGIKFFHTNDGTAKAERPADQSENNEDSSASGAYATAVGYKATASGERAIAFGYDSTVTGTDSISIGTGNIVNGNNSGAFGDPSIIDADKSYSVGNDNRIAQGQSDVFVLGNNVTKTESNSVFLGTQSGYVAEGETTKGNSAHTSQTIGGETYQYAGGEANQVKGVVSVGNVAQDGTMETRRIQNVAPGLVSETSTDAINGSQLYSLHSVVDKGWNLTSGTVEGSNGVSNQSAPAKVGMGETVRVNAGQNIVVNQNGRTLDIATTMAPTFNSLKVNPNGKVDMGGNRIQNVGQAINAGDAVNYGQLKAELGKVDNRLRSGIAGAVASASLVQAFNPSESILAVGGGTYRGASALAVGYSKVSDNGKIIIKVTGSANNRGDYTGGASVGFKF